MNVDELLAQVRLDLEDAATAPVEQLSAAAIAWLGLAPEWSVALAEASGFPFPTAGYASMAEWVERAAQLDVCRVARSQPYSGDGTDRFWMSEPGTSPVFSAAMERLGSPIDQLRAVARGVEHALEQRRFVWAESLRPWVVLAETSPYEAGDELLRRVRFLESEGDLHGAHRWIVAAQRLAPIMGPDLMSALRRARRHVALHHRRLHDEAVLRDYIPRPDLVAPFDALLQSESTWALHYLGDGGVGKTSLLRMLTAERTRRREPLLFARVDFDHVSPEYPWRRPAQLLSLLADELEISALSANQQRSLDEFRRSERRTSEVGSASESSMSLGSREFELALHDFAELLERLPGRVVLVLDTCEELAKFHEPGEPVAAVDFTFEILERLHALVPSTRVVFAGRRLLARGGADTAGWRRTIRHRERAPAGERPYLDLCEVRGFTSPQAESYLIDKRSIDAESMRAAILSATEELDDERTARHNPFDVALYAAWVADDPTVSADEIRQDDGVRYVEQRIVGRLEPDLDDAIPILVALGGRATPELLARACGSEARAEALHARLRLQEWIDPVATSMGEVLVVQPRLLARFQRFVQSSAVGSPRLVQARVEERLRASFERGIARRPSELSPTTAVVAFSFSADRATEFWLELEAAADRYDEWNELQRLASVLLADPSEGGLPESAAELRSLVAATHATATAQTGGGRRQILDRLSSAEPKAAMAETLSPPLPPPPPTDRPVGTRTADDAELVARNIAGFADRYARPPVGEDAYVGRFVTDLETVLDEAVRHGVDVRPLAPVLEVVERHLGVVDGTPVAEIDAYQLALLARWWLILGDAARAAVAFERAERALAPGGSPAARPSPGWIRPDHPIDRLRLMYAEAAVVFGSSPTPGAMLSWYLEACRRSETIDGNRLAARLLVFSTEIAEVPFVDRPLTDGDLLGPRAWTLALHDRVPPLVGAVAIVEAANGRPEAARARLAAAKKGLGRSDERLRRAIELVELRLSIVDGVAVEGRVESLARGDDARAPLAAAWLAIHRHRWAIDSSALTIHERWRTAATFDRSAALVDDLERAAASATGLDRDELVLDLREASLMRLSTEPPLDLAGASQQPPRAEGAFDTVSWERRVRCDLRRAALENADVPWRGRRAADLASEEAALVARRLPVVAAHLHEFARSSSVAQSGRTRAQVSHLQARLRQPRRRSTLRSRAKRSLPFLVFVGALLATGALADESSESRPSTLQQGAVFVAVLAVYVGLAWMMYGRRLYRGLGSLLPLGRRWPYWVAWRVELRSARDGTVSLERAARHDGVGSPLFRVLLLWPQVYTWWFERSVLRRLRRRMPEWEFALTPATEVAGPEGGSSGPPDAWRAAVTSGRGPVGVEIVAEYGEESRSIEREFAHRFGLAPETPDMVFFRRSSAASHHVVHPMRRSVRRAGVRVVAPWVVSMRITEAWSQARVRENRTELDETGSLRASRATTVHIVGSPAESSAGWGLELGSDGYSESPSTSESPDWFGPSSVRGGRPPRLVVLQPNPALEVAAIADARDVAGCRQVARAFRSAGCPVVIVLPLVSSRVGDELVGRLAELVADHHLDRLRLMDVSIGVRRFLADRLAHEDVEGDVSGVVSDFTIYTNR